MPAQQRNGRTRADHPARFPIHPRKRTHHKPTFPTEPDMKKTYTVIRLTLLAAICLLAACADAERMEDHLSQTEETMKTDPAKALDMLDSISRQNIPTREQQARYALLYT